MCHEKRFIPRTYKHWRRRTKFIRTSDLAPGICASWKNTPKTLPIQGSLNIHEFSTHEEKRETVTVDRMYTKCLDKISRVCSSHHNKENISHKCSPEVIGLSV
jgi:hypothetical protein